jgi:hypothetical protein
MIKVIDVMCPLAAGGTVALVGEYGTGPTVVMEELVRRLSGGADPVSLFLLMPPFSPEWPGSISLSPSISGSLKQEGYSEGTVGPVQTFLPARHGGGAVHVLSLYVSDGHGCERRGCHAKLQLYCSQRRWHANQWHPRRQHNTRRRRSAQFQWSAWHRYNRCERL